MSSQQEQADISRILRGCRNPVIVDLGSFQGEDTVWMAEACLQTPRCVLVEADMRNLQVIIDRKIAPQEHRSLILGAVADHDGLAQFHVCENTVGQGRGSSSIRKPTGHLDAIKWCEFPHVSVVPCYTLDSIFRREWLEKIDVLWVDIQGAERDMIAGGQKALERSHYLFVEAEDAEMYEGQATKPALIKLLPGWNLIAEYEYNILLENRDPQFGRI